MSDPVAGDGTASGGWIRTSRPGSYAWVALGRAPPPAQLSPMPVRLRELIAEQARLDDPAQTALHALSLNDDVPDDAADPVPLAQEAVQLTRAQIMAQASLALRAQANHTQQSVRALLDVPIGR